MSSDVLRFEFGTLTEFRTPNGRRYLRGDIGGLRFTLIEEPDREPAAGGVMRWSVTASPAPGKARHVHVPAFEDVRARETSIKPASKVDIVRAAAADAIARHGKIPPGGDPLPADLTAPAQNDIEDGIRLLETPLI